MENSKPGSDQEEAQ